MRLASPLRLGPVTLANRIVGAPMERNYCTPDGAVTDEYVSYLRERAEGGAALVFAEASYVRADGKGRPRQMGLDHDRHVPGLAALARAVHGTGALLGIELNHGGRTVRGRPVAPSAVALPGGDVPRPLDRDDVYDLVHSFGVSARRCLEAGVDVLSVHAAHGYLIHQFLSPRTNLRTDEFAQPTLFLDLVLEAVRRAAPGLCVGMRVSAFEGVPGGLDGERTLQLIRSARLDLLDFIDVSAGNYEAAQWMVQPGEWRPGLLAPYAAPYRELGLPVGVAGRIGEPQVAESLVAEGGVDFVSVARALHADPEWPARALSGRRFRPCIACNLCIDRLHGGDPVPCTVNPAMPVRPRSYGARIAIVGAGPAGLEAARRLAKAGHRVDLLEREPQIGGQFYLASRLHACPEYHRILDWYAEELAELEVTVRTGVVADERLAGDFAAVLIATGGHGRIPDVDGADLPHVIDVRDWLRRGEDPPEHCTIWGADREAMVVADHIAVHGGEVVIVGPQSALAAEVGLRARMLPADRLDANPKVRVHLRAHVRAIRPDHLVVAGSTIPTRGPVLVSHGTEPAALPVTITPPRGVHVIGEAAGAGRSMWAALRSGAIVATGI